MWGRLWALTSTCRTVWSSTDGSAVPAGRRSTRPRGPGSASCCQPRWLTRARCTRCAGSWRLFWCRKCRRSYCRDHWQPLPRQNSRRSRHRRIAHRYVPRRAVPADRPLPRLPQRHRRCRPVRPGHHLARAVRPREALHRPRQRLLRHPHQPRATQAHPHPPARSPRLHSHPPPGRLTTSPTTTRLRCAPPGAATRPQLTLRYMASAVMTEPRRSRPPGSGMIIGISFVFALASTWPAITPRFPARRPGAPGRRQRSVRPSSGPSAEPPPAADRRALSLSSRYHRPHRSETNPV